MLTLERTTLTSQAVEKIKEYIITNNLSPGDRLPPEREFCRMMDVSSMVVREAVKSLEAVGLIKAKVGDGMYVGGLDYPKIAGHFAFVLQQNGHDRQYLSEARFAFELGALEFAIRRIDDESIGDLERIVDRMSKAETTDELLAADRDFHKCIIEISDNPILVEFGNLIDDFFHVVPIKTAVKPVGVMVEEHTAIVNALRNRDLHTARKLLQTGLDDLGN